MRDLTLQEERVLGALADAANLEQALLDISQLSSDHREFILAIHAAQNIILARPAYEVQVEERGGE